MPEKLIFHNMSSVSKLYIAYRSPKGTCTFPHSYAASFSIKLVLCDTNNLFLAQNIKFDTKLVSYSERSSKINLRSRWKVYQILLTSAVIWIQKV